MSTKDYYKTLGIDKKASPDEVKHAYKKLAVKYHPDVNKESGAETKFKEINDAKIKYWILGHGHPAVTLQDGAKKEKYKCFLAGKFKGRNIIVLPSFFPLVEGSDARDFDLGFAWDFRLENFDVRIVGDNLEVLDFGKLGKLA